MNRYLTHGLRILLPAAVLATIVPTVAAAAFPGENGKIAMGCSTLRNAICVTNSLLIPMEPTHNGWMRSVYASRY